MTLIWKVGYTTGVPEMDEQHKHVFQMLNDLEEMISRGEYDSPAIEAHIQRLGSHVAHHFSREEGCMDRVNCPMAMKNKQEHERFLARFVAFATQFKNEKSLELLARFHSEAENWLHEHVAFVDVHLRSCSNHVKV